MQLKPYRMYSGNICKLPQMFECLLIALCKKVTWSHYRPGVAQRVDRGVAVLFMVAALEGGEWSAARPGCTLPLWKIWYPFYRRLCIPQGQSRWAEYLVLTGIWSETVQPVVSCCTDWATQPALSLCIRCIAQGIPYQTYASTAPTSK